MMLMSMGEWIDEIIVDSFAGGGGASEGVVEALGRDPDIAVNHNAIALAMHRINHPGTHHLVQDVAVVDSRSLCEGKPIGMLWMSPDCTDHSKAKGSAPNRVGVNTRGIGWAILGWIKALPKWQRPRVIFLENVEEYVDWSPLRPDGTRCPKRKGETFKQFVGSWRAIGYHNIEWRVRRAWKSGAPTIRNRLYMIMRRDDEPVIWPEPTHGNPNDAADMARIKAGELKPWVTVAECIDFGLPCPSIFDTAAEIRAKHGIRAKRPLVHKTLARLAKGVKRYVLDSPRPFLVKVNHTGDDVRDRDIGKPAATMTGKRDDAVVVPVVTYAQQGGGIRSGEVPLHTITASAKDQNAIVVPYLVPRYGERPGQEPRTWPADQPGATPVPTGNEGNVAAIHMMTMRPSGSPSSGADKPARTIVADGAAPMVVAAHIGRQFGNSIGREATAPNGTDTAGGDGKSAVVSAFIAQHNTDMVGHDVRKPVSTIVGKGSTQQLVAAHMMSMRGSDRRDAGADQPARTESSGGTHNAVVSLPLMAVYYGTDDDGAPANEPSRTETAKPRFGLIEALAGIPPFGPEHEARARRVADFLREHDCWDGGEFVTIEVDGVTLILTDLCMRMLTPRERFTAQGFRRDYIIDRGLLEDGTEVRFTLEQQGYMCGNSVCPPEAAALIRANYQPRKVRRPAPRRAAAFPLLEAAE